MIQKPLARRVVAAARKFQDWEPWLEFTDEHLFAFEVPGEDHPVYGLVLGAAGKQFGLSLYRGERALEQVRHITAEARPPFVAPMLLLSFDPPGAVPREYLELAHTAGSNDRVVPVVATIPVGGRTRPASAGDLRLVAQVVEAMLHAADAGLLRPRTFDPQRSGKVLTLAIEGENAKVRGVTARFTDLAPPTAVTPGHEPLPWPLAELPLLDSHRVVAFEPSPFEVEGEPHRLWLLLIVDAVTADLSGIEVLALPEPDDLDEAMHALARMLAHPKAGEAGLPRHLTFVNRRLAAALSERLTERGVTVDVVDEHPSIRQVTDSLREHMARDVDGAERIPDAADQARWLPHHRELLARVGEALAHADLHSQKALAAFFGDADVFDELDEEGATLHRVAYRDWFLTCYRGKTGRRTVAERLLAEPLPAAERCLLTARVEARTGLYRVASRRPPVVVLSDVFSDHEVEIHDGTLASSTVEGAALPARIADANGHRFVVALGPLVPPLRLDAALADLQERWGTFTSADLQRRPEMLASMWDWSLTETARARSEEYTNTDGDELCSLVATFRVADWPQLHLALADHPDIEDADAGRWDWLRRDPGGDTLLASLERVVDELLVEANSEPRLALVRGWLEAVPGVAFVGQRAPDLTDDTASFRRQRRDVAELSPADLAHLQAQIDAQTMRWLDERVPMLGDRTPREAVRAPEGRELVLRLVRSWPDPGGIPGLRTPRERLLRELGLGDAEAATES